MISIQWPSNTDEVIDAIRRAIGRSVTFEYVASSYECPICNLDPVTNTSDDAFCLICSGDYYIDVIDRVTISAVITWDPSDRLGWESTGQLLGGDCTIQIDLSDDNEDIVNKTKDVIVDGRVMEIRKTERRGVQPLNRMLLSLIEREKEED